MTHPKLRLVIELEYNWNPEHYETDAPEKAAEIDQASFRDDPGAVIEFLNFNDFTCKVEVVK